MTSLLLEHLLAFTVFCILLVAICGGIGVLFVLRTEHPAATASLGVAMTLVAGAVFTVTLNNLWAVKRDRDAAIRNSRSQHLERLRPILRAEADHLASLATSLSTLAHLPNARNGRRAIWTDDVMAGDIQNHFRQYYEQKEQFIKQAMQQDAIYQTLVDDVSKTLSLSSGAEGYRLCA